MRLKNKLIALFLATMLAFAGQAFAKTETTSPSAGSQVIYGSTDGTGNAISRITASTVGSTTALATSIVDDTGAQITSFGSPSTIAVYTSPSDFTATYTSATTITLGSLPFTISDSSQIVYIRVIPASGDASVYVNGSGGVTLTISGTILTISGVTDPFASGDAYEIGINGQAKGFDPSLNALLVALIHNLKMDAIGVQDILSSAQAITTSFVDVGPEIPCFYAKKLILEGTHTINDGADLRIKVLRKLSSGATVEAPMYAEDTVFSCEQSVVTDATKGTNGYFEFATDADSTWVAVINLDGGTDNIQIQASVGTDGGDDATIDTLKYTLAY